MDANSAVNFQEIYCQQQPAEQRRACCVLHRDIILSEKKASDRLDLLPFAEGGRVGKFKPK
jgi:hypothetical protein